MLPTDSVGENIYMLPTDMNLKLKSGTVGYNNKILVSDSRFMHQSIPGANIPPGRPLGNFFEVVESPAPGQNFPAKARPPGQKHLPPGQKHLPLGVF